MEEAMTTTLVGKVVDMEEATTTALVGKVVDMEEAMTTALVGKVVDTEEAMTIALAGRVVDRAAAMEDNLADSLVVGPVLSLSLSKREFRLLRDLPRRRAGKHLFNRHLSSKTCRDGQVLETDDCVFMNASIY
jgi:enoyl-CoA hydratase/carnithine racemase